MTDEYPEECTGCGASGTELTEFTEVITGKGYYCPYCMVALDMKNSQTKNLSNMFNLLEKRLKEYIDKSS